MSGRTVLATLAGSSPLQRIQVTLAQHEDGRLSIELRDQHFAEGIGWFDQRALDLDPRQFRQLQAVLGSRTSVLTLSEEEPRATVPFPGPATRRPMRPAVGDA
ncbi:MAG: hypothetical protein JO034_05275 [Singulisphaera sp.]|nr:hypothetical protein [Singulisphaera sp.]